VSVTSNPPAEAIPLPGKVRHKTNFYSILAGGGSNLSRFGGVSEMRGVEGESPGEIPSAARELAVATPPFAACERQDRAVRK
jgi:hypothetical protein